MKYPKLKHALLCRILTYVVVIGGIFLPCIAVSCLPFVPAFVKGLLYVIGAIVLLAYIVRNSMVLMFMDVSLAMLHCHNKARTQYALPSRRTLTRMETSISRYGRKCAPTPILPQPDDLRYSFQSSIAVYAKGIEKVVAVYHANLLDIDAYRAIFSSAKTNSKALTGTKKPRFLDKAQQKAPLNRVTAVVIFAQKIDEALRDQLYELVCKQSGDDFQTSVLPCVIDLEHQTCVFNSLHVPYIGYAYAVKNRGIRLIERLIFGGKIHLAGNDHFLPAAKDVNQDVNPEDSLWDFWRGLRYQFVLKEKETKMRYEAMDDGEIQMHEDMLYVKWGKSGICQSVELDPQNHIAKVESVRQWVYPKMNPIAKKTIQQIEQKITAYFAKQGYTVEYVNIDVVF